MSPPFSRKGPLSPATFAEGQDSRRCHFGTAVSDLGLKVLPAHQRVARLKHDASEVADVRPDHLTPEKLRHLAAADLQPEQEPALEHLP